MTIYLYKKTHNLTGLKYLGQTSKKDPYSYTGSGKYWKLHIKKHGYNVTTEILKECSSKEELKYWGMYYSKLWNVVKSDEWANLKLEEGDGGKCIVNKDVTSWQKPESVAKRSGNNHYSKKQGYKCKTVGDNNPMRRADVIKNRLGDLNPMRNPAISKKCRDQKIYLFERIIDGKVVMSSRYDFIINYKIPEGNLSKLLSGKRLSVNGWRVVRKGA